MTKRVNWLPSLRIDRPDLTAGTNDLATGTVKQLVDQEMLNRFARVTDGFRVEIANQGTSPGEFTIYNGAAFDRDGNILLNEDEENTQRSFTLIADGQYFVEISFLTNQSDTDARAFWDSTVDNGTDPSGDPRLPGREFSQNVSTRLSPDWQIVTPVSTTGFEINTNANSVKVPVAVIQIAGGVIVNATTQPARTCLEEVAQLGASRIKVVNSRNFPDVFTATLGAEAISVAVNDRRNGILTLAVGLAGAHQPGERLVRTGGSLNQFLVDRVNPTLPTTQSQDARPRFFQGWPLRGSALSQDPSASSGRSDTQLAGLKDYVDFLSAQVRELKFGSALDAGSGNAAPPAAFPATPQHYDVAGSVAGARAVTVSVGDGVISFGDFNSLQSGSFDAAFTAALAALPATGGTILVKHSSTFYATTTGFTLPAKHIRIIGEDRSVEIRTSNANSVFTMVDCLSLTLEHIKITQTAGATAVAAVRCTSGAGNPLIIRNCTIHGLVFNAALLQVLASGSLFEAQAGSNGFAIDGDLQFSEFVGCTISAANKVSAGARAFRTRAQAPTGFVKFSTCSFVGSGTSGSSAVEMNTAAIGEINNYVFDNCQFTSSGAADLLLRGFQSVTVSNCRSNSDDGFIDADAFVELRVANCTASYDAELQAIDIGSDAVNANIHISDCEFLQSSTGGAAGTGIRIDNATEVVIRGCSFATCDSMVTCTTVIDVLITECTHRTSGDGRYGVRFLETMQNVTIQGCVFGGYTDDADGLIRGVEIADTVTGSINTTIANCEFAFIGSAATACNVYGVYVRCTPSAFCSGLSVTGCHFQTITSADTDDTEVIATADAFSRIMISNNTFFSIGLSADHARAICIRSPAGLQIIGNSIALLGNSSTAFNTAILTLDGATNAAGKTVISGNTILAINVSSEVTFNGCIGVNQFGAGLSVVGNICEPGNEFAWCIAVSDLAGLTQGEIIISDNVCGTPETGGAASCALGILVVASNASGRGRIVINGNTIRDMASNGVYVGGTGASDCDVAITGNVIHSDYNDNTRIGIQVDTLANFAITGNVINYPVSHGQDSTSIFVDACLQGTVAGNHIFNAEVPNAGAIQLSSSGDVMISGNMVRNGSAAVGRMAVAATGIPVAKYIYVAGNLFTGFSNVPVNGVVGANGSTLGRSNAAGNNATAPGALGDVCLNVYQ